MINSIDEYLLKLKKELLGFDPDTGRDALSDSEEHLREALNSAHEIHPGRSEPELLREVIENYGTPDEVALTYKVIEARKDAIKNKESIRSGLVVFISILFTSVYFLCQGILLLFHYQFYWGGFGRMVHSDIFLIWAITCSVMPIALGILARHVWISYRRREKDLPLLIYVAPIFPFLAQGIALICYWAIKKSDWWGGFGYGTALLLGIISLLLAFIMLLTWITVWKNLPLIKGIYEEWGRIKALVDGNL